MPESLDSHESLVDVAIAEYLRAKETPHPFDIDEWLLRHPQAADALCEFLRDEGVFGDLVAPLLAAPDTTRSHAAVASDSTLTVEGERRRPRVVESRSVEFDDFEILDEIARGGMGVVYRVRQRSLNRIVALKMVLGGGFASPGEAERLYREAEAAAGLDHPNIVPVYAVGEHEGRPFFAMKLVPGGSLADHAADLVNRPREAATLVATVARAVYHAHQRGILHRDLKPSNILMDGTGAPHVTDFGLARRLGPGASVSGAVAGTPSYMAPEQARGEKGLTTAVDVYGLGGVLYFLLTGVAPFKAESTAEVLLLVLSSEPVAPRVVSPTVPPDLETICLKCLAKEPTKRYGTAAELADDLDRWLAGEPIQARPTGRVERAVKWTRRNPAVAALTAVSVLAMAAVIWSIVAFSYNAELTEAKRQTDEANDGLAGATVQLGSLNKDLTASLGREQQEKQNANQLRQLAEDRGNQVRKLLYAVRFQNASRMWCEGRLERATETLTDSILDGVDDRKFIAPELILAGITPTATHEIGPYRVTKTGGTNWDFFSVAFDPTGRRLALVRNDTAVHIVDPRSGESVDGESFLPALNTWPSVTSPNKSVVVTGGATPAVWTTTKDRCLRSFKLTTPATEEWSDVWFTPDSQRVISFGTLKVNRSDDTRRAPNQPVPTVAVTLGSVRLWDVATGELRSTICDHDGATRCVVSVMGELVVTFGGTCGAKVWNFRGEELLAYKPEYGPLFGATIQGRRVTFAAEGVDRVLKLTNLEVRPQALSIVDAEAAVGSIRFSPNGESILTLDRGKNFSKAKARTWKVPDGRNSRILNLVEGHGGSNKRIDLSPDGRYVGMPVGKGLALYDAMTGQPVRELAAPVANSPLDVAFSSNGRWAATANDRSVHIWDLATEKVIHSFQPGDTTSHYTGSLAFSPDSQYLAVGTFISNTAKPDALGFASIWEVATGKRVRSFIGEHCGIWRLAWSPDGTRLAVASGVHLVHNKGSAKVWDPRTGELVYDLKGHSNCVWSVAFSPDGRRLATCSGRNHASVTTVGEIKLWDMASGLELLSLPCSDKAIFDVSFSPDGRWFGAAGMDGKIRLWDLKADRNLAAAPDPTLKSATR